MTVARLTGGLRLIIPSAAPWMVVLSDSLHEQFDVNIDKVMHATKTPFNFEYRSSEHCISISSRPNEDPPPPPNGKLNISSMVNVLPGLLMSFPDLAAETQQATQRPVVENDQIVFANGSRWCIFAHMYENQLNIPAHSMAKYLSGYNELMHLETRPEITQDEFAVRNANHRREVGNTLIITALWQIVQLNAKKLESVKTGDDAPPPAPEEQAAHTVQ